MLGPDSPLLQLPPQIDRKQAVFFDGIRYAAEIMTLAYSRLQRTLTEISSLALQEQTASHLYTPAYLDAWVIVDSIDRIRSLLKHMPGKKAPPRESGVQTFRERTESIRLLRNVADHIHQRVDYVVSRKGTALGTLGWFTLTDQDAGKGITCVIVPGTVSTTTSALVNPGGKICNMPTGLITLTAGEYSACLCDMVNATKSAVELLEAGLSAFLTENGFEGQRAGTDMLMVGFMSFDPTVATANVE